jgi:hypothetical protein
MFLYQLIAPTPGTHTVSVSLSSAPVEARGISISYTGAAQSVQPDVTGTSTASDAPFISVSLHPIQSGDWGLILVEDNASPSGWTFENCALRTNVGGFLLADTNAVIAGAAVNFKVSHIAQNWGVIAIAFKQAGKI